MGGTSLDTTMVVDGQIAIDNEASIETLLLALRSAFLSHRFDASWSRRKAAGHRDVLNAAIAPENPDAPSQISRAPVRQD